MRHMGKKLAAFRLDEEQLAALEAIKQRDGIPMTEQLRRALDAWFKSKGLGAPPSQKKLGPPARRTTRRKA